MAGERDTAGGDKLELTGWLVHLRGFISDSTWIRLCSNNRNRFVYGNEYIPPPLYRSSAATKLGFLWVPIWRLKSIIITSYLFNEAGNQSCLTAQHRLQRLVIGWLRSGHDSHCHLSSSSISESEPSLFSSSSPPSSPSSTSVSPESPATSGRKS